MKTKILAVVSTIVVGIAIAFSAPEVASETKGATEAKTAAEPEPAPAPPRYKVISIADKTSASEIEALLNATDSSRHVVVMTDKWIIMESLVSSGPTRRRVVLPVSEGK